MYVNFFIYQQKSGKKRMGNIKTYPHISAGSQSALYTYWLIICLYYEFAIVQYSLTPFDTQTYSLYFLLFSNH